MGRRPWQTRRKGVPGAKGGGIRKASPSGADRPCSNARLSVTNHRMNRYPTSRREAPYAAATFRQRGLCRSRHGSPEKTSGGVADAKSDSAVGVRSGGNRRRTETGVVSPCPSDVPRIISLTRFDCRRFYCSMEKRTAATHTRAGGRGRSSPLSLQPASGLSHNSNSGVPELQSEVPLAPSASKSLKLNLPCDAPNPSL